MKILHCLRAPVGGLFRHVRDLAVAQAALGHDVGVLCDLSAHDSLTEARLAMFEPHLSLGLHRVAMSRGLGWRDVGATWSARSIERRIGVDVLHGHGAKGGAYARCTRVGRGDRSSGPIAVYTPHGGSLHYDPGSVAGRVFLGLERALVGATDGFLFESAFSARAFEMKVGLRGQASAIVPNGLLPDEFADHAANDDAADVLFVGELRMLKGVDLLIEALALLARDGDAATAVIVGEGPDADAFKALAAARGLAERVSFPGAMPAQAAFPLGRCLVVPSRAESFPYIVLEAAAQAMPLIATHVGGIPEIVGGADACLVPAGDAAALASAIRATRRAPDATRAIARDLQLRVAERFTVSGMTRGVLGFYETCRA